MGGWLRRLPRRTRVSTPTVLQMEATECGAACLAIVLAHYGLWRPLEELRVLCGVSRDGSRANLVLRAARHFGMDAKGQRLEPKQTAALPPPTIVFWNFDHFVVLEGASRDRVYLNDPATGRRTVSWDEFDRAFTGIVLTMRPNAAFRRGGRRPAVLPALRARLRGHGRTVLYLVLCSLLLLVPSLLLPLQARIYLDDVVGRGRIEWWWPLALALLVTAGVMALLTWMQRSVLSQLETRLAGAGAVQFLHHLLQLPIRFFLQRHSGDLGARVATNDAFAALAANDLAVSGLNAMLIGFYALMMSRVDARLTVVTVTASLTNLVLLRLVTRARADATRRMLRDGGQLMGTVMTHIAHIESVKAGGGELDAYARWAGYHARLFTIEQRLHGWDAVLASLPVATSAISAAALLALGGARVMDGTLSVGMLTAFQTLSVGFSSPVQQVLGVAQQAQEMAGSLARLDDVLSHDRDVQLSDAEAAVRVWLPIEGRLELRDVTFGYGDLDEPLLRDFSLTLAPGQRVALVGGSGSGKTTVARIAAGLYPPRRGQVLIDGRPRSAYRRDLICRAVSFVDQDITLFSGTVRDNLTLWDPTVPDAALVRAAKDADIHDDIALRPGGYDAAVEEGGRNFSGGQRQRLELARALVTGPRLLILDEATSALDAASESRVDDGLRRRGCTCLIVAHRLSTIRDCDEILVLEAGRIVERGTHDALLALDGAYAGLVRTM